MKDQKSASSPSNKLRRWHTLSGALALGVFLVEHLAVNAFALGGDGRYDSVVGVIERWPFLPVIEIIFILLPLGFHVGFGIQLLRSQATSDANMERYGDRRLWVVQRITGSIVLVFVLVHLWELRVQKLLFGADPSSFYTMLTAHLSWTAFGIPWLALFYLVGIAATTFHFANGLFAATAAWGIWTNRRFARVASSVAGVVLFLVGAVTVIGIATGTRLLPAKDAETVPCGSAAEPPPIAMPPAPSSLAPSLAPSTKTSSR